MEGTKRGYIKKNRNKKIKLGVERGKKYPKKIRQLRNTRKHQKESGKNNRKNGKKEDIKRIINKKKER